MNLATTHLGLPLNSPFIVGSSPLCDRVALARRLEEAGASAVVLRSLFEEQFQRHPFAELEPADDEDARHDVHSEFAPYQFTTDRYLRHIERLKQVLRIPVIASLNGTRPGNWTQVASRLEAAGADAIELNCYQVATDIATNADAIEIAMLQLVRAISSSVSIPVGVKLSPFHTSLAQLAIALEIDGAAGLTLFNRFYQPDVNVDEVTVQPVLHLSEPGELLLRLRWLAILSPHVRGSLAATGGVHTAEAVVKSLLTGAHAVQLVAAVLRHGPSVITRMREGLEQWMRAHGHASIDDFRGALNVQANAGAYERANYIRTLHSHLL